MNKADVDTERSKIPQALACLLWGCPAPGGEGSSQPCCPASAVALCRGSSWQHDPCNEEEELTVAFILLLSSTFKLREEFDRGLDIFLDEHQSVHDVAALLKEFLRDMPDSLIPRELYAAFLSTACEYLGCGVSLCAGHPPRSVF